VWCGHRQVAQLVILIADGVPGQGVCGQVFLALLREIHGFGFKGQSFFFELEQTRVFDILKLAIVDYCQEPQQESGHQIRGQHTSSARELQLLLVPLHQLRNTLIPQDG